MTQRRRTVVPFERPAAYWAVRARRHYHAEQLPDAARLMRKALEKSGDAGLALELSQIYSAMGCLTAAERCLIRVSARQGLTGSLSYAVACCALSRGEEELAERALDVSLRLEPDGPFAPRAQELLETYPWREDPCPPRCARGMALYWQSRDALARGDRERALLLSEKAWRRAHLPLIALQLGDLLPPRQALPLLRYAARGLRDTPDAFLSLARALHALGGFVPARLALRRAAGQCRTVNENEALCQTAWAIGQTGEALRFVEKKLAEYPASVELLRLKYLCLVRLGQQGRARRTLETLLEIDGEDASALWYRRHPGEIKLLEERRMLLSALGSLVYAHPDRLKRSGLNRALHMMVMALRDEVDIEEIYRELPPVYRRLSPAARRSLDLRQASHDPLALAAYLYGVTGHGAEAGAILGQAPGRKRLLRAVRRMLRWRFGG